MPCPDLSTLFYWLGCVNRRRLQPWRLWRRNTGNFSSPLIVLLASLMVYLVVRILFFLRFRWPWHWAYIGGVELFQQDYAFVSWAGSASGFHFSFSYFKLTHFYLASLTGDVDGMLEYLVSEQKKEKKPSYTFSDTLPLPSGSKVALLATEQHSRGKD